MSILVTRPEPGASRTVAALEARGLAALSCPLFNITASGAARPSGRFAALLVTSGHGAAGLNPAFAELPATMPVFAVGDRTAQVMTANGFSNVTSASGDQKTLTKLVLAKLPPRYRVLLATGEDHKEGLAAAFADAGHEIALWIRYRAEAVGELPEAARAAIASGSVDTVLHYSRRASETFVALVAAAGLEVEAGTLRHVVLSTDVAEPLAAAGFAQVSVAGRPDEDHMLSLALGDEPITSPSEPLTAALEPASEAVPPAATRRASRMRTAQTAPVAIEAVADAAPLSSHQTARDTEAEASPTVVRQPDDQGPSAAAVAEVPAHETMAPEIKASPVVIRRGLGSMVAVALASGLIGAGLVGFVAPLLQFTGVSLPPPPALAELSSRLARLEASRPGLTAPELQAAIQTAVQSTTTAGSALLREQISGLERRLGELAARPSATGPADQGAIAELRVKLAEAERTTQMLGSRLAEVEKVASTVGAPGTLATGAAKLIMADRLANALKDGRPFASEIGALSALGAAAEPMRVLSAMAASGAPSLSAISAEFRKLRPVFAAEPAGPDAPWSERLLKLTDGLVRVRSTGAVQGASPPAVASRIDQALQRGDSAAAAAAFTELPEPARRAGEAWIATLRQRASADQAVKTITDDAIKALSVRQ